MRSTQYIVLRYIYKKSAAHSPIFSIVALQTSGSGGCLTKPCRRESSRPERRLAQQVVQHRFAPP
jgi:hypothetical protein